MSQRSVMSLAVACMLAVALSVCIEPVCEGSFGDGYSGTNIVTMGGGGFDYVVPAVEVDASSPQPSTNASIIFVNRGVTNWSNGAKDDGGGSGWQ